MKTNHWLRVMEVFLLVSAFIISLVGGPLTGVKAQEGQFNFLTDSGEGISSYTIASQPDYISRARYTSLNLEPLQQITAGSTNAGVTFNLFPDATFTGKITSVSQDGAATVWSGNLTNADQGYFYIVKSDDAYIAHVASTSGVYEVSSAGSGDYKVVEFDQSKMVDDYPAELQEGGQVVERGSLGTAADSGATIDVMVFYTATARAAEGSTSAMRARIALAVSETNQAYANVGVTTRLRLVYTQEVTYAETGDLFTDLSRLVNKTDGILDAVHSLRNTYGADMVSLIVNNGGAYCGLADAIMASESTAFDVVARDCSTGYYSFGHEFGHLQGARHDTYVDPGSTPYAYGHGYVHTGSTTAARWRTIMAYNNKCADLGYSCTRLQYFSNPTKQYNSAAMGVVGSSEVYKVVNNTDYTVANFRVTKIGQNFNSSFNGSSSGWAAAYGSWSIYNSAYFKSTGSAGKFVSAKHTGNYGDLTYTVRMKRTGSETGYAQNLVIRGVPTKMNTAKEWSPSIMFEYSNYGTFSIWKISSTGVESAIKTWTASSAIKKNDWNILKVVVGATTIKYYINGTLVYSGTNTLTRVGQVGFMMYKPSTGTTGDAIYVDYATLSNTPSAAMLPEVVVDSGVTYPGDATGMYAGGGSDGSQSIESSIQ